MNHYNACDIESLSPSKLGYSIYDQVSNFEETLNYHAVRNPLIKVDYVLDANETLHIEVSGQDIETNAYAEGYYPQEGIEEEMDREIMYDVWVETVEDIAEELKATEYEE